MAHHSRIGVIVIDCQEDDLTAASDFWAHALGVSVNIDGDGKYAKLGGNTRAPKVLLQSAVGHSPRVHLDIETDNQEAEATRLEKIGARIIERHPKGWIVMQAPSGHRFCLVNPQNDDFPGNAVKWENENA